MSSLLAAAHYWVTLGSLTLATFAMTSLLTHSRLVQLSDHLYLDNFLDRCILTRSLIATTHHWVLLTNGCARSHCWVLPIYWARFSLLGTAVWNLCLRNCNAILC